MRRILAILAALTLMCTVCMAEAPAGPLVYLALGDSISTGYGLAEGEKGFADIVAEEMGYTLINRAINGNTSVGILAQMKDPLVLADVKQADVITITCGGNDLMGMLFQAIADAYNAAVPPILAIKADNVSAIMSTEGDPRQQALMLAARTVLEGNAEMGIEPEVKATLSPEQRAEQAAKEEAILNTKVYSVYSGARLYHSSTVCGTQSNRRPLTVEEALGEGLGACPDCNPPVYGFTSE